MSQTVAIAVVLGIGFLAIWIILFGLRLPGLNRHQSHDNTSQLQTYEGDGGGGSHD